MASYRFESIVIVSYCKEVFTEVRVLEKCRAQNCRAVAQPSVITPCCFWLGSGPKFSRFGGFVWPVWENDTVNIFIAHTEFSVKPATNYGSASKCRDIRTNVSAFRAYRSLLLMKRENTGGFFFKFQFGGDATRARLFFNRRETT